MDLKTIQLHSDGLTFSALEAGTGTPVILLHGFPDTAKTWEDQIPALVNAGYRVIAPTCRGYEVTSQPINNNYGQMTLGRDVLNWMDNLKIDKAHLVGHDWGSSIAQTAAHLAPNRFHSLTIMAVPPVQRFLEATLTTPKQLRHSWYMGLFQLRWIAERKVRKNNFAFLERLWQDWSPGLTPSMETLDDLKRTFARPGVVKAALSYYRQALNIAAKDFRDHRKLTIKPFELPVMAVSGKQDGCIDHSLFLKCIRKEDFLKGVQVAEIKQAGHFMNQEQPEEINQILLEWFQKNTA